MQDTPEHFVSRTRDKPVLLVARQTLTDNLLHLSEREPCIGRDWLDSVHGRHPNEMLELFSVKVNHPVNILHLTTLASLPGRVPDISI